MARFRIAVAAAGVALAAFAHAGDRGTPADAKAMLARAAEHYKTVGRKQALG